jgi:hypothetical protein
VRQKLISEVEAFLRIFLYTDGHRMTMRVTVCGGGLQLNVGSKPKFVSDILLLLKS